MVRMLREVVVDAVAEAGGTMTLLQLRAHLAQVALGSSSAQQYISHEFSSLPAFLRRFPADLSLRQAANREALMSLSQFDAAAKAMKSDCASSFMLLGSVAHFVM